MHKRTTTIYMDIDPHQEEIMVLFESIFGKENLHTHKDFIIATMSKEVEEETFDYDGLIDLIFSDFGTRLKLYISPDSEQSTYLEEDLIPYLSSLKQGVYTYQDLLLEAMLTKNDLIKTQMKSYLQSKLNQEVIYSARAFIDHNMNSSLTAKATYMHRNTLNYRIDQFIELSHIDIKTFKGAMVLYLLYK